MDKRLKSISKAALPTKSCPPLWLVPSPKNHGWNVLRLISIFFKTYIGPKVPLQNNQSKGCISHELINPKVRSFPAFGLGSILIENPTQIPNGLEKKLKWTQSITLWKLLIIRNLILFPKPFEICVGFLIKIDPSLDVGTGDLWVKV